MGARFPSVFTTTFIGPLPANANETVVLTTPPFTPALDGVAIFLLWFGCLTAGATVTQLSWRIRRGTTVSGAVVGANPWANNVTAGNFVNNSGWYIDTPGAVGGQQYTLTVVQSGASGAGAWQDGAFIAFAL